MWNVVHRPVPELAEKAPDVSPEVTRAIMAGLDRDPQTRITMTELGKVLSKAAVEGGATATELATLMQDLFAEDKREAEEHLERTLSNAGAVPEASPGPTRLAPPIVEPGTPSRRRWPVVAYAVGGVALAALLAERFLPERSVEAQPAQVEARTKVEEAPPPPEEPAPVPVAEPVAGSDPRADPR